MSGCTSTRIEHPFSKKENKIKCMGLLNQLRNPIIKPDSTFFVKEIS